MSELHDEIRTEIFSRVPAKSVGKFRCLSKKWNHILSSPHFINLHLSRKTHQESLILKAPRVSNSFRIVSPPIENPTISKKLELGYEDCKHVIVMGSCNGLLLLLNSQGQLFVDVFLVNPVTLERFKVPRLTFDSKKYRELGVLHGLGYDISSDDYKILIVSYRHFSTNCSVDLYSVKSGVWKSIDNSLYGFAPSKTPCGVYVNGSIHWYNYHRKESKTSYKILAFNFTTEAFHEVDIPLDVTGVLRVFAHDMRLCALNLVGGTGLDEKLDVWMMKEYRRVNSWTKLASIDVYIKYFMFMPLCFSRDMDILLVMTENIMVVYNIREGTMKAIDGVQTCFPNGGCSFVGSLVSLKGIVSSS